ncbi:MAG: hypothetical protein WCK27_29500 [Verrucomicrobiota bacterium]
MNSVQIWQECYGKLLPDFTGLRHKERLKGCGFTALVISSGTGAQGRSLEVKTEAWEQCVPCPDYRACYDLSLAKLEMSNVLTNTTVANPWVGGGD